MMYGFVSLKKCKTICSSTPPPSPHCRKKAKAAMLKASRKDLGGQDQMMAEDSHVISAKGLGIIARCVMRKIAT